MEGEGHKPRRGASPGVGGAGPKCLDSDAGGSMEEERHKLEAPVPTKSVKSELKSVDSDAGSSKEQEEVVVSVESLAESVQKLKEQFKSVEAVCLTLQTKSVRLGQLTAAAGGEAEQVEAKEEEAGAGGKTSFLQPIEELEEHLGTLKVLQREVSSAAQTGQSEPSQPDEANKGAADEARAEESPKPRQLLSHADMVHYLDVTSRWDEDLCVCCFDRAVSQRARRALAIKDLDELRCHLRKLQPRSIPAAAPEQQQHNQAAFESCNGALVQALREQHGASHQSQSAQKPGMAPRLCAEAMVLEWMAEPRVGVLMDLGRIRSRLPAVLCATAAAPAAASSSPAPASAAAPPAPAAAAAAAWPAIVAELGASRQREGDNFASMLVQVLGVKESANLQKGFGFLVQQLLSGGLEKAHAESNEGARGKDAKKTHVEGKEKGKAEEKAAEITHVEGKGRQDASHGEDDGRQGEEEAGSKVEIEHGEAPEKLAQDPPQHTSEAGRDGRRAKDAEGQGGSHEGEWSMARGIAEAGGGSRSARRRDSKAIELGAWEESLKSKARAIAEEFLTADVRMTVLPPPRRKLPIVRCLADVDFLVKVTGCVMDPPACAHCKACSADFMLYACTVALIANFAYRPVSHLFSRVLSLFPPPSRALTSSLTASSSLRACAGP
ncbi:unnamed protein product [Closterium sp. NIES-64]|nr:unnamed protein product [Closterium sp. NIES-64]